MKNSANSQPKDFVDFKNVKASVSIVQVLERYGIFDDLNQSGDRLSGRCPIHSGSNTTQFRVSISKNCFNCFGKCGRGGNVIDFVSMMEGVPFRDAAILLQDWFIRDPVVPDSVLSKSAETPLPKPDSENNTPSVEGAAEVSKNLPLTFELKSVKSDHSYMDDRGLTTEAIEHFGLGYCTRGCMRGRIVIPIHNAGGELVAYAGRWPGIPESGTPKYKLPKGFKKSLEVFNLHRAIKQPADLPLVIVEGFFDCIALWEAGIEKCVAVIGSKISSPQAMALSENFSHDTPIEILFDADEAGKKGAVFATEILADFANIRSLKLPHQCMQPDQLCCADVPAVFE